MRDNIGMSKKSVVLIILLLSTALLASGCRNKGVIQGQPADPNHLPDLAGTYAVNGVDPAGENYGGTLTIEPGDGPNAYKLHWIVTGAIQEGEGRIEGNQLVGRWWTLEGITAAKGELKYTITTLGELDGERTVEGFEQTGWEKAFPNDEKWGSFKLGH